MKQSGISRLFILLCIAVLMASYGVGLGVRKIRFDAAEAKASEKAATGKPDNKSESDDTKVEAKKSEPDKPSEQLAADGSTEVGAESSEQVNSRPERPGGRNRMRDGQMGERLQNMSDQQREEAMARMREMRSRRSEGGGGSPFMQMSDEDRQNFQAEMGELNARAGEMSDEERQAARNEILEKYGLPTGGGRGRRGGRE